ncbi:hypothetical protein BDV06DRAFT_233877 [Aspergillus oleicola]
MSTALTPEQIAYYQANAGDDLRPNQIAACTCGIAFALVAVAARLTARYRSDAKFGWDDYFIIVALMGQLTYACLMAINVANGEGLHIIFVKDQRLFVQVYVGAIVCYSVTIMLTKISILLLYRRMFPARWLWMVSLIIGAVVIAYNMAVIFVAGFQCIPLSSLWTGQPGQCINTSTPFTTLGITNVVTDFAILALPIQPVLGLQMETRRKIQVLGIFLLGGVYNSVYSGIWSYTEISVGIVAACMPTLRPLFIKKRHPGDSKTSTSGSLTSFAHRWKYSYSLDWSLASRGTRHEREQDDIPLTQIPYRNHNSGSSNSRVNHSSHMLQRDEHQAVNIV